MIPSLFSLLDDIGLPFLSVYARFEHLPMVGSMTSAYITVEGSKVLEKEFILASKSLTLQTIGEASLNPFCLFAFGDN